MRYHSLIECAQVLYGSTIIASPIIGANMAVWYNKGDDSFHNNMAMGIGGALIGAAFGVLSPIAIITAPVYIIILT